MAWLTAAITLGFFGSFHCIGMCGPIALSLPVHHKAPLVKYTLILLYNLGRILTYSVFGLLAGIAGRSLHVAGLQQSLSVGIGLLLLFFVFVPFKGQVPGAGLFLWVRTRLATLLTKGKPSSLFITGLLNGFLPCGMVYMGIAGAIATGDVVKGTLFMAVFGAGTLPMMLLLPLAGASISLPVRNRLRKSTPVIITVMALLLILRGMNLGIPYLSPEIDRAGSGVSCHEHYPDKSKMIRCSKPHSTAAPAKQEH